MQPSCEHTRTVIIARRDGVDYVECLDCRQIFEAEDLEPVTVEKEEKEKLISRPLSPPVLPISVCPCVSIGFMHDLGFFRSNFEKVAERLATRGPVTGLDQFRDLDQRRRAAITEAEELKARRNTESAEIAKLRKAGQDTAERQQQVREIGSRIGVLDEQIKALDDQFRDLLAGIPNLPHESVPVGSSAED